MRLMLTQVAAGRLTLPAYVRMACEAPARAYRTGKSFEVDRKPREGTAPARVRGDRRSAETSEAPGRTAHAKPAGKRPPSGDRPTGGPKGGPAGKPRGRDADRRR